MTEQFEVLTQEKNEIALAAAMVESIRQTEALIETLEAQQKAYKEELTALMVEHNVTKITNDFMDITLVPASEAVSVDSKKLKEEYFDTYLQCTKLSKRNPYVKIRLRQV